MGDRVQPLKLALPGEPDAFLYVSGHLKDRDGDEYAEPTVSFVVMQETVAAEWCPPYGPISIWYKGDDLGHYTFPRIATPRLDWSQSAVDREGLPQAFAAGNYARIAEVLRSWATSHQGREVAEEVLS